MVELDDLKAPPHNIEAEKGVISAIMNNNDMIKIAFKHKLTYKDFYKREHQYIYKAIQKLYDQKKNIDTVTISNQLDDNNLLEDIGWSDKLYNLMSFVAFSSIIEDYAPIVKDKSTLRTINKVSKSILADVNDNKESWVVLSSAINRLKDISTGKSTESVRPWDIIWERFDEYLKKVELDDDELIEWEVKMPFMEDYVGSWLKPWQFVVLWARPSMGKTALALNMSIEIGKRQKVGFLSLETKAKTLVDRMVSSISGVPLKDIDEWNVTEEELSQIGNVESDIQKLDIVIGDSSSVKIADIRAFLTEHDVDILFIDYLQRIKAEWDNRVVEIGNISRWLAGLAMEFDIPIVALAQLSRGVEQRTNKRPQMSDIKWSSAVEQDAYAMWFLYSQEYYEDKEAKEREMEVIVAKNKDGGLGTQYLKFTPACMKFEKKDDYDWLY